MNADELIDQIRRDATFRVYKDEKMIVAAIRALVSERDRQAELNTRHFTLLKMTDEALDKMTVERDSLLAENAKMKARIAAYAVRTSGEP